MKPIAAQAAMMHSFMSVLGMECACADGAPGTMAEIGKAAAKNQPYIASADHGNAHLLSSLPVAN